MKKILVTGAEGFIGSHLVELLVRKKYFVRALVLYSFDSSNGWLDNIDKSLLQKIEIGVLRPCYLPECIIDIN